MKDIYAGTPSIPPHIAAFNQLGSIINAQFHCQAICESFNQDPISFQHENYLTAVYRFILDSVEQYIDTAGVDLREVDDIYSCLHQTVYGDMSSPLIERLDLEELTKGNRTVIADRSFYEFFQRNPHLHQYENNLRTTIFSFFNEMTKLANPELGVCTEDFNNCCQNGGTHYVEIQATEEDGTVHDGFGLTDDNGEVEQCIFPRIRSFIKVEHLPEYN